MHFFSKILVYVIFFYYLCAAFCTCAHAHRTTRTNIYMYITYTRMIHKQTFFKAFQRLVVVGLVVMIAMPMSAQRYKSRSGFGPMDNYHFGYISGTVGYSMLQTNFSGALPKGNLGGAVGVGYEFRNSGFWTSVGVQLSFHRSSMVIDQMKFDIGAPGDPKYQAFDTQGHQTTFHYRVNQVDEMEWNFLDVPILFGYYVKGFHIGAGIKVSYALNPHTRTTGSYNLSATNHNLGVTFENMPERGYTDYSFNQVYDNHLNVGVSMIGEIGYDLLSKARVRSSMCHVLRLSFYVEYGLNNHLRDWDGASDRISFPEGTITQEVAAYDAHINPYISTFVTPARTVPFYTGIKLTYMIGGNPSVHQSSAREGGCMCYQTN